MTGRIRRWARRPESWDGPGFVAVFVIVVAALAACFVE